MSEATTAGSLEEIAGSRQQPAGSEDSQQSKNLLPAAHCVLPAVLAASPDDVNRPLTVVSESRARKTVLVDEAYQEFCKRCDAGEPVDPDQFCANFPSLKSSLGRILQAHLFLEEDAALWPEPAPIAWPRTGEAFLDFRLLLQLGKGAFARVFLATQPKLGDRLVAVKISQHGGAEAEILGRINHPNIVPVFSVQEDLETGFTVVCMPYVGSATLCDVLDMAQDQAGPPESARVLLDAAGDLAHPVTPAAHSTPAAPILRTGNYVDGLRLIGVQLADALAYLHERGICHRDLKPSNVLLSPQGAPMLLDFNLSADAKDTLARWGGTLPYMSPEQLRETELIDGAALTLVDARSDIFSLGVILYQLLTGDHPFGPIAIKASTKELRKNLLQRQQVGPIPAHEVNRRIDRSFSLLIQRCLAFDPKDRPQSAAAIASALHKGLSIPARTNRWIVRNPKKTLAAAFAVLALGVAGIAAAALQPPVHERQYSAGMEAYQQGDFKRALGHFEIAVDAETKDAKVFFARARTYQQMAAATGDLHLYDLAIANYTQANKLANDGQNHAGIGFCLNRLNPGAVRGAAPIEPYKKAIDAGFATAEVYNNLGHCHATWNREDAHKYFDQAIKLNKKLQVAYHNRARLHLIDALNRRSEIKDVAENPAGAGHFADGGKKIRAEYATALKGGMADIDEALKLGPVTAELSYLAAQIYGIAAGEDNRWTATALRHLTDVVDQGLNPGNLAQDHALASLLKEEQFNTLVKRIQNPPAPLQPMVHAEGFVDPIVDRAR